jgi:hypothetical protein
MRVLLLRSLQALQLHQKQFLCTLIGTYVLSNPIFLLQVVMRKRQQKFNYGQRCTPVSLDAYSLDSVSVCGSVRRKGGARNSKRSYGNAGFDDPVSSE